MRKIILLLSVVLSAQFLVAQDFKRMGTLKREGNHVFVYQGDIKERVETDVVTVKLKPSVSHLSNDLNVVRHNKLGYIDISVPEGMELDDFLKELDKTGQFDYVNYNVCFKICSLTNDTYVDQQWYLDEIKIGNAWSISKGNPNIKVAVIDSEIDVDHPDLGQGNDSYANISPLEGWNFRNDSHTFDHPTNHGTMVAGIIAAKTDNNAGIAGIAGGESGTPGVKIIPFGLGDNDFYLMGSAIDDAIIAAVDNGAKVINMSLSTLIPPQDINDAIDYAYDHGVTLVASSGNDNIGYINYPASNSKVIAVGSMGQNYHRAEDSRYGLGLDLVAPGENILSTSSNSIESLYTASNGTSFSAPQVSAAVALMYSVNPFMTPARAKSILTSTCKKLSGYSYDSSGWNNEVGYGLLDVYAALKEASNIISGPTIPEVESAYYIEGLPSGCTVLWSYSGTPLGTGAFQVNNPSFNQCTIDNSNKIWIKGTLQATVINGMDILGVYQKTISSGYGFTADFEIEGGSGTGIIYPPMPNVLDPVIFYPATGTITDGDLEELPAGRLITLTSNDFIGANISYLGSSGTVQGTNLTGWQHNNSEISFRFPIFNMCDTIEFVGRFSNSFKVYKFTLLTMLVPHLPLSVTMSNGNLEISIVGSDESDAPADLLAARNAFKKEGVSNLDDGWRISVSNVIDGRILYESQMSLGETSKTINTSGWPKGFYAVNCFISGQNYSKKIYINNH